MVYASATPAGAPVHGHVVVCHDLPRPKGRPPTSRRPTRPWPTGSPASPAGGGHRDAAGGRRSVGDFSAQGWLDDLALRGRRRGPRRRPALVGRLRLRGCPGPAPGIAATNGWPVWPVWARRPTWAMTETPGAAGALRAHRRDPHAGFPASVDAWAKELSVLHPTEDAALLKGRPLLMVHGADDPDMPLDDARALADAATGPSDLHVLRRRPLATGRPPGDRHPGGLAGTAALTASAVSPRAALVAPSVAARQRAHNSTAWRLKGVPGAPMTTSCRVGVEPNSSWVCRRSERRSPMTRTRTSRTGSTSGVSRRWRATRRSINRLA